MIYGDPVTGGLKGLMMFRSTVYSLMAAGAALVASPSFAVSPVASHIYDLNNGSLVDTLGGPSLTTVGSTSADTAGVNFAGSNVDGSGSGLALTSAAFSAEYSVEMYFKLTDSAYWPRLINTNGADSGLYGHKTDSSLYEDAAGIFASGSFNLDVMNHLVLSRGASTTKVFLNGAQVMSAASGASTAITAPAVQFFVDDGLYQNSSGFIDYLRVYGSALDGDQVSYLYGGGSPLPEGNGVAAVPEMATWAMMVGGFGAVGVGLRRRKNIRVAEAA